jgi:hypothetical protein
MRIGLEGDQLVGSEIFMSLFLQTFEVTVASSCLEPVWCEHNCCFDWIGIQNGREHFSTATFLKILDIFLFYALPYLYLSFS